MPKKKTDIIKQLEKGKELLESGGIDVESLKTKFSEEPTSDTKTESNESAPKKRKRRTKAEMETDKKSKENADVVESEEDNRPEWEKRRAVDHDEFCQWELEKAKLKGVPEPEFDFRNHYEKGQIAYFVRVMPALGEKEVVKVILRTIYPRLMVGSEEKGCCHCIGYNDRDKVFLTPRDADIYYKSIKVTSKYDSEEPKSRRKKNYSTDEDAEEESGEIEAYTASDDEEE
jgi:hypothetical protein